MQSYDPEQNPDPAQWLGLDEATRMKLVAQFHQAAGIRLTRPQLHVAVHAVVENQIAQGMPAVADAMQRLRAEGVSRHDALHAVAAVLARHLNEMLQTGDEEQARNSEARYAEALGKLNAQNRQGLA